MAHRHIRTSEEMESRMPDDADIHSTRTSTSSAYNTKSIPSPLQKDCHLCETIAIACPIDIISTRSVQVCRCGALSGYLLSYMQAAKIQRSSLTRSLRWHFEAYYHCDQINTLYADQNRLIMFSDIIGVIILFTRDLTSPEYKKSNTMLTSICVVLFERW